MTIRMPTGQKLLRPHVKSRSGCRNCKRRKVKCGEERPSCRNCSRRGETCDLLDNAVSDQSGIERGSLSRSQPPPLDGAREAPTLPSAFPVCASADASTSLTMLDLELMHHYSISTSLTLSSDPIARNYFLSSVPQLGFAHPYVLHSVLALAASHMAHFRPESRQYYYAHAKARHTAATSMATPLLSNMSASDAIPMYCFSIMTLFIAFASLKDEDDLAFDHETVVPRWLALFRGVRTVLESNNRAIYSSPISFLFHSKEFHGIWICKQSDLEALVEFQGYIDASTTEDEQTRQLLLAAFQDIRKAFQFFYPQDSGNEFKIRSLFTWMYKVPDEFLSLLRQGNSKALCILAFFCVLLHRLEYNWWFQGWGMQLIERIYVVLDNVHRFWIRWPVQEIGWIPKREARQLPFYSTPPMTQV